MSAEISNLFGGWVNREREALELESLDDHREDFISEPFRGLSTPVTAPVQPRPEDRPAYHRRRVLWGRSPTVRLLRRSFYPAQHYFVELALHLRFDHGPDELLVRAALTTRFQIRQEVTGRKYELPQGLLVEARPRRQP